MTNEACFIQLILKTLRAYGATVHFEDPIREDREFWSHLADCQWEDQADALSKIADALRKDTSDFLCIDEIIDIVEPMGYDTLPRHNF